MAVTLNQIKAEMNVPKYLSYQFSGVYEFANEQFNFKDHSPEIKHLCKLKDILRKIDEHYESMFSKKNSEPSNRGPIHAEWMYNQAKYVKEKYIGFWNKYVEHDSIYKKYRKLYNKYLKQILN